MGKAKKTEVKKTKSKIKEPKDRKKLIIRLVLLVLIALWTYVIFSLSGQSGDQSSGLSTTLVRFFIRNNEELVTKVEPYVRKVAHLTEYAINGFLFMLLFNTYDWTEKRQLIYLSIFGVWYASLDELHQLLVPGRAGKLYDVWIDWLGFMIGACFTLLIIKIIRIIKEGKNQK